MVKRSYQYSSIVDLTKNMIVSLIIIVTRRKGILFPLSDNRGRGKSGGVALYHLECLPYLHCVVLAARSDATAIGRPGDGVHDVQMSSVSVTCAPSRGQQQPHSVAC